jgi:hypothetical protein
VYSRKTLEAVGLAEGADDDGGVLMLGVDGAVEAADVGGGEFSGKIGQRGAELRKLREGGLANDGDGIVGREVVAVIGESYQAESIDEAVSGVAGDDINLVIEEGTVDEAEVHDFGRFGEAQAVTFAEAGKTVGALEEFVADAGAPFGNEGNDVGNFLQVEVFRVVAADDHGEGVFEAERFGDFEMEAVGVELLDAVVDSVRIALLCNSLAVKIWRFVEYGGEGGAGVFDVEIEFAGEEGFVNEEGAAEVGLAFDGDGGFGFDVLGEELGEDDLFGEKFGADDDLGLGRLVASGSEVKKVEEKKEVKESERGTSHS